jgi:hypothetical protein
MLLKESYLALSNEHSGRRLMCCRLKMSVKFQNIVMCLDQAISQGDDQALLRRCFRRTLASRVGRCRRSSLAAAGSSAGSRRTSHPCGCRRYTGALCRCGPESTSLGARMPSALASHVQTCLCSAHCRLCSRRMPHLQMFISPALTVHHFFDCPLLVCLLVVHSSLLLFFLVVHL